MRVSPEQIAAARALLHLNQEELARRARLSVVTVRRIESPVRAGDVAPETCLAVQLVLEHAGIEFIEGGVRRRLQADRAALLANLQSIARRSAARQGDRPLMTEADLYDESGLPA